MTQLILDNNEITKFKNRLYAEEKSAATAEKYVRNVTRFAAWLGGRAVTKELAIEWKNSIIKGGFAAETVNACLAALNKLFYYHNKHWKLKYLHVQRKTYRDEGRDLSKAEYRRILQSLKGGKNQRLYLIIETICSTGIRASELKYISVEAAEKGAAVISLKGKTRTVLLPQALCKKLLVYANRSGIYRGVIFVTRNNTPIDRRQIWQGMKRAGRLARVEESKVYPHNLRHLFARTFYDSCGDIVKLSDVLGHSSVDTTRIYLISTGAEHRRLLEHLDLVC